MNRIPPWLFFLLLIIAVLTFLSGAIQWICPKLILAWVGGSMEETSIHFFRIVGMFMLLFGGLLVQALMADNTPAWAIFWCMAQKMGAAVMVTIALQQGLFNNLAWAVAGFDFVTALLLAYLWKKLCL